MCYKADQTVWVSLKWIDDKDTSYIGPAKIVEITNNSKLTDDWDCYVKIPEKKGNFGIMFNEIEYEI